MLRVILFDLGSTLIDAQERPFPHVADALRAIQQFVTPNGRPIVTALVSDFDMPTPPSTPAKVKAIVERYLDVLDRSGLRPFFEPVRRRVTLSAHAGVFKPDRRIFETALTRLKTSAVLEDCVLITENPEHVRAARTQLGMQALQFRSPSSATFDFDDWLQVPAMLAHIAGDAGGPNAMRAVRLFLDVRHAFDGVETVEPASPRGGGTTMVHGTIWKQVPLSADGTAEGVFVPFPSRGQFTRGPTGQVESVHVEDPASNDVAEAASFVRSLTLHGQVEPASTPLGDQSTHAIEVDAFGRPKLLRRRLRAI